MTYKLKISDKQADDLELISQIAIEQLDEITKNLQSLDGSLVRPKDLTDVFNSVLDDETSQILTRHLINLSELKRDKQVSGEEVLEAVSFGLKKAGWSDDKLSKWEKINPRIQDLMSTDTICAAAKLINLSFDYSHILKNSTILTDIRPVWGNETSHVLGAIITQTLRINYRGKDGSNEISLALDESDIKMLMDSCTRALDKAEVLKNLLTDKCDIQSYVTGEELYES